MIERGAKELNDAVQAAPLPAATAAEKKTSTATKARAVELYHDIVFKAFDWQRSGIVDQLSKQEDEDIRQRTDEGVPKLPRAEIEKMITKLREEMAAVVAAEEFERAAQVRNRIAELQKYITEQLAPRG